MTTSWSCQRHVLVRVHISLMNKLCFVQIFIRCSEGIYMRAKTPANGGMRKMNQPLRMIEVLRRCFCHHL